MARVRFHTCMHVDRLWRVTVIGFAGGVRSFLRFWRFTRFPPGFGGGGEGKGVAKISSRGVPSREPADEGELESTRYPIGEGWVFAAV